MHLSVSCALVLWVESVAARMQLWLQRLLNRDPLVAVLLDGASADWSHSFMRTRQGPLPKLPVMCLLYTSTANFILALLDGGAHALWEAQTKPDCASPGPGAWQAVGASDMVNDLQSWGPKVWLPALFISFRVEAAQQILPNAPHGINGCCMPLVVPSLSRGGGGQGPLLACRWSPPQFLPLAWPGRDASLRSAFHTSARPSPTGDPAVAAPGLPMPSCSITPSCNYPHSFHALPASARLFRLCKFCKKSLLMRPGSGEENVPAWSLTRPHTAACLANNRRPALPPARPPAWLCRATTHMHCRPLADGWSCTTFWAGSPWPISSSLRLQQQLWRSTQRFANSPPVVWPAVSEGPTQAWLARAPGQQPDCARA